MYHDDENDEFDEGPGEHDAHLMDEESENTLTCPSCGKEVWAEADQCPECGNWFANEVWSNAEGQLPAWVVILIIVLLVVAMAILASR